MPAQEQFASLPKTSFFAKFIPFIILGVFCALGGIGYVHFLRENTNIAQERLHHEVQTKVDQVQEKIERDIAVIRGVQGLFVSSDVVDRDEFSSYLDALELTKNYPGILSVVYGKKVKAEDLEQFVTTVRGDTKLRSEGYPNVVIYPTVATDSSYIVTYIYPEQPSLADIGYVISSDPVKERTINQAVLENAIVVSELVSVPNDDTKVVLMIAPITTPGAEGVAIERIKINSLLSPLSDVANPFYAFSYRVTEDNGDNDTQVIVDTIPAGFQMEIGVQQVITIPFGAVSWTITFVAPPVYGLTQFERMIPIVIAVVFVVVGMFFFLLLYQAIRQKERAVRMAETMIVDLKESESRFRAITDSAKDAIVMMNSKMCVVLWNKAAEGIFGYTEREMLGVPFHQVITTRPEHQKTEHLLAFGQTGESAVLGKTLELPVKKKDGTVFIVELTVSRTTLHNEWHAVGIMRDVTERTKQVALLAEQAKELERMNKIMVDRELKMIELKKQTTPSV